LPYLFPADRVGLRVEGHGPPVVLLHSSMSSKSQWRELIESLRGSYRLIAIDLLGYGESAMPGDDSYSLADEVSLVEAVLARELRADEQFHLIGHSYGGIVALQLTAQAHSQRVRSLSLFEPIAFHLLADRDPDLAALETERREIAARLSAGDAFGAAECFVDYWSGTGAFARLRDTRQAVLAAAVPKVLLEYRAVADEARNAAAYRRIEVPICLVAGIWSPEPAQRLISMFADLLPHASCFEVAAGHMGPITHPALVNPIFEQFVRAVDSSERRTAVSSLHERPRPISRFENLATAARWQVRARAAAFGLLGIALSVLPLFATQSIGQHYVGIPPDAAYPLEQGAWHEAPPGLAPGGTFAVISGDPFEPGPFVMRVRLPPGYILPPYQRRNEEQMIVLAGAITVGTGSMSGADTRTLTSGSYVSLPANEIHFANTRSGAIVQIFGMGPFELEPT
jgi:pimeloyl-ACP methyl ester carboxylesterase/quercetin dioxygenase-like cupin family protein